MRGTTAPLVGLTLLLGLTNAQSAYDNTCNPPPVGEKDVEPGVVATYDCATWYDGNHSAGSSATATTPEICASECAKRSPEGPCTWYGNLCYFYNAGAPTMPASAAHREAVSINTRKDWDKLKVAYYDLKSDYNTCKSDLTTCKTSLGTGAGGGGGPPGGGGGGPPGGGGGGPPGGGGGGPPGGGGGGPPGGGGGGPPGGGGGSGSSKPLSAAACEDINSQKTNLRLTPTGPGSNNDLLSHGGRNWKLVCKKSVFGSDATGTNHGAPLSRDECVDACASNSQCSWAHWNQAGRGCWTYTSSRIPGDFTETSTWDVYLKV